ncbi:MAG: hypothetical protein C0406_05310 [Sideroxydans sp.]|nr:hypothetical protein [Sideroxydans sp.]
MHHHLTVLDWNLVKSTSHRPTFTDKTVIPALLLAALIPFAQAYAAEAKIHGGCGCEIDHIHSGMDWNAPIGQPIPVAREGDIVEIGKSPKDPCGNFIVIKHRYPNGKIIYSRYAQLGTINLEVGQHVQNAAIIGQVGEQGTLHFEVRPAPASGENIPWKKVSPVNPATFNFDNGESNEPPSFPFASYPAADLDLLIKTDIVNKHDKSNGVDIWSPFRKIHVTAKLLEYPKACNNAFLGRALAVSNVSLQNLPPINTCIRIKSRKGNEQNVFIQDQVGDFLSKEVRIGGTVELYAIYVFANTVSNTLGMVVNEFQVPTK